MQQLAEHRVFDGRLVYCRHRADVTACDMDFTVFVPPGADATTPVLWWLSGLTCTAENFTTKAGAYRAAARHGLVVVAPDTSPRGAGVPDDERYFVGQGAGFYVDATEPPWNAHYRMYSYVTEELPALVFRTFPGDRGAQGICGHSMGGHGALVIGLRRPAAYRSISALAPIAAAGEAPWGQAALPLYLGDDAAAWRRYDATALMGAAGDRTDAPPILIDQGLADPFLDEQLRPGRFAEACTAAGQALTLREHAGYDHGYFFVATFIDDHLAHHAALLRG